MQTLIEILNILYKGMFKPTVSEIQTIEWLSWENVRKRTFDMVAN